jgi:hypothetical protein
VSSHDAPVKYGRDGRRMSPASLANLQPGAGAAGPGNRRRVDHGGYAAVLAERLGEKVRTIFEAIGADVPLRDFDGGPPREDSVAIRLLAEVLCRLDDVGANIRDFGLFDRKSGELRPAVDLERRLRLEAADHADALGLNPRARVRLGIDLMRSIQERAQAVAMSETDPERQRELMQAAGLMVPPPDAEERSRRAARLLAETGALDIGDGDGPGEGTPEAGPGDDDGDGADS